MCDAVEMLQACGVIHVKTDPLSCLWWVGAVRLGAWHCGASLCTDDTCAEYSQWLNTDFEPRLLLRRRGVEVAVGKASTVVVEFQCCIL